MGTEYREQPAESQVLPYILISSKKRADRFRERSLRVKAIPEIGQDPLNAKRIPLDPS